MLHTNVAQSVLIGLPSLEYLDLSNNKIHHIVIPSPNNPTSVSFSTSDSTTPTITVTEFLPRLEHLNLGFNNLINLPEELVHLSSLRTLKVMNNLLDRIPEAICNMELKILDASSNPLIQPPIETCDRGIEGMKRYYQCLKEEGKPRRFKSRRTSSQKKNKEKARSRSRKKGGMMRSRTVTSSVIQEEHNLSASLPPIPSVPLHESLKISSADDDDTSLPSPPSTPIIHYANVAIALSTSPPSDPVPFISPSI